MHSRDGEWLFVPPVEGAIVVNVGDLLMRWSNDVLRSTPHCVMDDPRIVGDVVPARYSMAYFCNPSRDTLVECLPTCTSRHAVVLQGSPRRRSRVRPCRLRRWRMASRAGLEREWSRRCAVRRITGGSYPRKKRV